MVYLTPIWRPFRLPILLIIESYGCCIYHTTQFISSWGNNTAISLSYSVKNFTPVRESLDPIILLIISKKYMLDYNPTVISPTHPDCRKHFSNKCFTSLMPIKSIILLCSQTFWIKLGIELGNSSFISLTVFPPVILAPDFSNNLELSRA